MEVNRILMGLNISIHAPREGCDGTRRRAGTSCSTISIHAPREGCDPGSLERLTAPEFQSTHPARGATPLRPPAPPPTWISIHAPREGCDEVRKRESRARRISIHAPREGCDGNAGRRPGFACLYFNPRTPRGVRPPNLQHSFPGLGYFNPRTPRGVRQGYNASAFLGWAFQSTHPARGATIVVKGLALEVELFQSTHPARGATANFTKEQRVCLAQFAYLHKGKKAEHTKTNAPMLHEAFLYAFWVRTGRRRRVLLDFARYKIKGSSGR